MNILWTLFGVQVVPVGEVILKVHLQLAMLFNTLYQYSIGQEEFFGVYIEVWLLLLHTCIKIQ